MFDSCGGRGAELKSLEMIVVLVVLATAYLGQTKEGTGRNEREEISGIFCIIENYVQEARKEKKDVGKKLKWRRLNKSLGCSIEISFRQHDMRVMP